MNLRIQTTGQYCFLCIINPPVVHAVDANTTNTDEITATDALQKGLDDLMDLCDVVTDKFTTARDSFNAAEADKMTA